MVETATVGINEQIAVCFAVAGLKAAPMKRRSLLPKLYYGALVRGSFLQNIRLPVPPPPLLRPNLHSSALQFREQVFKRRRSQRARQTLLYRQVARGDNRRPIQTCLFKGAVCYQNFIKGRLSVALLCRTSVCSHQQPGTNHQKPKAFFATPPTFGVRTFFWWWWFLNRSRAKTHYESVATAPTSAWSAGLRMSAASIPGCQKAGVLVNQCAGKRLIQITIAARQPRSSCQSARK